VKDKKYYCRTSDMSGGGRRERGGDRESITVVLVTLVEGGERGVEGRDVKDKEYYRRTSDASERGRERGEAGRTDKRGERGET